MSDIFKMAVFLLFHGAGEYQFNQCLGVPWCAWKSMLHNVIDRLQ